MPALCCPTNSCCQYAVLVTNVSQPVYPEYSGWAALAPDSYHALLVGCVGCSSGHAANMSSGAWHASKWVGRVLVPPSFPAGRRAVLAPAASRASSTVVQWTRGACWAHATGSCVQVRGHAAPCRGCVNWAAHSAPLQYARLLPVTGSRLHKWVEAGLCGGVSCRHLLSLLLNSQPSTTPRFPGLSQSSRAAQAPARCARPRPLRGCAPCLLAPARRVLPRQQPRVATPRRAPARALPAAQSCGDACAPRTRRDGCASCCAMSLTVWW